jgi:hypothetical protein
MHSVMISPARRSFEEVTRTHETGEKSEEDTREHPDPDCHAQPGIPIGLLVMDCECDHSDKDPDCDGYRHRNRFDDGRSHFLFGGPLRIWARYIERFGRRTLDITRDAPSLKQLGAGWEPGACS